MVAKLISLARLSGLSRRWQMTVYLFLGAAVGMAVVVARIANAASYLSNAPRACINCHVMTDAYASWQRGSHSQVAVCTDCHVPQSNLVAKLKYKATDGLKHSYVFTMRKEPQVLMLSEQAVPVVQANCTRCHEAQLMMIRLADSSRRTCWDCHSNIHGSVRSLSASPGVLRSQLPAAGLKWLKKGVEP